MGSFLLERKSTKGISPLILVKLLVFRTYGNILVFGEEIAKTLLEKTVSSPLKYCPITPIYSVLFLTVP
jgi:hypothetical protein